MTTVSEQIVEPDEARTLVAEILAETAGKSTAELITASEPSLREAISRTATHSKAYHTLLAEQGLAAHEVTSGNTNIAELPLLGKENTVSRFNLDELVVPGTWENLHGVLTSSGQGGLFSFGLSTAAQAEEGALSIDIALATAFDVHRHRTLVINMLPMGVVFSSLCCTVATVSVREDMALALIDKIAPHFEQLLLVSDPVFFKHLLDTARMQGKPIRHPRLRVVLGEEVFGEHYRQYIATQLGLSNDELEGGAIISSMGVGELGLHLLFETAGSQQLRRLLKQNKPLASELLKLPEESLSAMPTIKVWDPRRCWLEISNATAEGWGDLTLTMLDEQQPMPLPRYQTGDLVQLIDTEQATTVLREEGIDWQPDGPWPLIALLGRTKDQLPGGGHVAGVKDALYSDPDIADQLSGAFRIEMQPTGALAIDIQLGLGREDSISPQELSTRLLQKLPTQFQKDDQIKLWPQLEFPHRPVLDFERKFRYWAP